MFSHDPATHPPPPNTRTPGWSKDSPPACLPFSSGLDAAGSFRPSTPQTVRDSTRVHRAGQAVNHLLFFLPITHTTLGLPAAAALLLQFISSLLPVTLPPFNHFYTTIFINFPERPEHGPGDGWTARVQSEQLSGSGCVQYPSS